MRVLVLCDDTWHPAATVRQGLARLQAARGGARSSPSGRRLAFEFLEDGAAWSAARMGEFPLVILAKANIMSAKNHQPWLGVDLQQAFPDYVRRGNGLLVIHGGTSRYEKLPAMNALLGGAFVRHPEQCLVTVEPEPRHPLAAGVSPFTVRDEHYFMAMGDPQADVFLQARSEHGVQPAGWTRAHGKGRVCVLTPGHNLEVWLNPGFQRLLSNALNWSANAAWARTERARRASEAPALR